MRVIAKKRNQRSCPTSEKFELYVDEDGDYVLKMKGRAHHHISVHGHCADDAVAKMVDTLHELDGFIAALNNLREFVELNPNFRQSSSPMNRDAESAHSGKQNTADKSELLPTQLPKEK